MSKANLRKMILEEMRIKDEDESDIEKVLIGVKGWNWDIDMDEPIVDQDLNQLDYEFHSGFGGENAHSFYVYTEDWIYLKQTYDGSESVAAVPRNPNEEKLPRGIGGG